MKTALFAFEMMFEMELAKPESSNRDEDLNVLSTSVNPVRLKNNPVKMTNADIYEIYNTIIK